MNKGGLFFVLVFIFGINGIISAESQFLSLNIGETADFELINGYFGNVTLEDIEISPYNSANQACKVTINLENVGISMTDIAPEGMPIPILSTTSGGYIGYLVNEVGNNYCNILVYGDDVSCEEIQNIPGELLIDGVYSVKDTCVERYSYIDEMGYYNGVLYPIVSGDYIAEMTCANLPNLATPFPYPRQCQYGCFEGVCINEDLDDEKKDYNQEASCSDVNLRIDRAEEGKDFIWVANGVNKVDVKAKVDGVLVYIDGVLDTSIFTEIRELETRKIGLNNILSKGQEIRIDFVLEGIFEEQLCEKADTVIVGVEEEEASCSDVNLWIDIAEEGEDFIWVANGVNKVDVKAKVDGVLVYIDGVLDTSIFTEIRELETRKIGLNNILSKGQEIRIDFVLEGIFEEQLCEKADTVIVGVEGVSNENRLEEACYGCNLKDKCVPIGYITDKKYCDLSGEFTNQLEESSFCENNFECSSNVCVSGECVSANLIQKIINWFKLLFGG